MDTSSSTPVQPTFPGFVVHVGTCPSPEIRLLPLSEIGRLDWGETCMLTSAGSLAACSPAQLHASPPIWSLTKNLWR